MADVVTATLTQTLAEDALQAVADKYDTPNNCSILTQVKGNELIWSKLDAPAKSSDLRLQKIQGFMALTITAITRLMEKVLKQEKEGGVTPACLQMRFSTQPPIRSHWHLLPTRSLTKEGRSSSNRT